MSKYNDSPIIATKYSCKLGDLAHYVDRKILYLICSEVAENGHFVCVIAKSDGIKSGADVYFGYGVSGAVRIISRLADCE